MLTYAAALAMLSDSLSILGIDKHTLGSILVFINIILLSITAYICWIRWRHDRSIENIREHLTELKITEVGNHFTNHNGVDNGDDPIIEISVNDTLFLRSVIQFSNIKLQERIGIGGYNVIFKGQYRQEIVAVKSLKILTEKRFLAFRLEVRYLNFIFSFNKLSS